jgi:hypothetical protein
MNVSTFEIICEGLKIIRPSQKDVINKDEINTITSETIPKSSHKSPTEKCSTTSSVNLRVRGNLERSPSRSVLCP